MEKSKLNKNLLGKMLRKMSFILNYLILKKSSNIIQTTLKIRSYCVIVMTQG